MKLIVRREKRSSRQLLTGSLASPEIWHPVPVPGPWPVPGPLPNPGPWPIPRPHPGPWPGPGPWARPGPWEHHDQPWAR